MAMATIPEKYEHTCDCCGKVEITKYKDPPAHWDSVVVNHRQYEGTIAVGGYEERKEFCHKCFGNFKDTFEGFMNTGRE